jgi:hypothetical protein
MNVFATYPIDVISFDKFKEQGSSYQLEKENVLKQSKRKQFKHQ